MSIASAHTRAREWRFALLPAVACAAAVFVLSVVLGGGFAVGIFSGICMVAAPSC